MRLGFILVTKWDNRNYHSKLCEQEGPKFASEEWRTNKRMSTVSIYRRSRLYKVFLCKSVLELKIGSVLRSQPVTTLTFTAGGPRRPCKSSFFFFFLYLGFLPQPFTNHWTAGKGGGYFFNSSLPLPPVSRTLRHYPGDYCRGLTSTHS